MQKGANQEEETHAVAVVDGADEGAQDGHEEDLEGGDPGDLGGGVGVEGAGLVVFLEGSYAFGVLA